MRKFKITLAYEGTAYHGWQIQKGQVTIQEVVEKAVRSVTQEKVRVIGAGRTDAGVHALGQVAHFRSTTKLSPKRLKRAINSQLPSDIRIMRIQNAVQDFHAQYWAKSKIYRYQIWNDEVLPVFERLTFFHHPGFFNCGRMRRALRLLAGRHDFSSFSVNSHLKGRLKRNPVRRMSRVHLHKKGPCITIELEADGFLYKMVRSIVGTLMEVGEGKLSIEGFKKVLRGKDRTLAGKTAPPQGLCLVKVKYTKDRF
jgi:tRNA pseudouridine38-40 synthase